MSLSLTPAILGAGLVTALVVGSSLAYFFLKKRKPKVTLTKTADVPTCNPSDPSHPELGNFPDITKKSLHQFLSDLHKEKGDVVGYWHGTTQVVSVYSPETLKATEQWADRPFLLFSLFEPIIGPLSIQYQNGTEMEQRRQTYISTTFSVGGLASEHWDHFVKAVHQFHEQIADNLGKEVNVNELVMSMALKSILHAVLGLDFDDSSQVLDIYRLYEAFWDPLQRSLGGVAIDQEKLKQDIARFKDRIRGLIAQATDGHLFLDSLKQYAKERGLSPKDTEEFIVSECITHVIGGFHTSGTLLIWELYYIAKYPEVLKKIHEELRDVKGDVFEFKNRDKYIYIKQVTNETLRVAALAPWAAREAAEDCTIGPYNVKKGTPVIQALGVFFQSSFWKNPTEFDPDRFSPEVRENNNIFYPFGFAGRRSCPGRLFSNAFTTLVIASTFKQFTLQPISHTAKPVYGLVTHPHSDIFLQFEKL